MPFKFEQQLSSETRAALKKLTDFFTAYKHYTVAFSGGMDSSLLAAIIHHTIGPERYQAVNAITEFSSAAETRLAMNLAEKLGLSFRQIRLDLLSDVEISANDAKRCYYCKKRIFGEIIKNAVKDSIICEGSVTDDDTDYRPGKAAIKELVISSPLHDCGFSKKMVAEVLIAMGLPELVRPAQSCLATRIPTGTPIEIRALQQIEKGEALLHALGLNNCRLRHHGNLARIEVSHERLHQALDIVESARLRIQSLGFRYVCLDLAGYQRGSMNSQKKQSE